MAKARGYRKPRKITPPKGGKSRDVSGEILINLPYSKSIPSKSI